MDFTTKYRGGKKFYIRYLVMWVFFCKNHTLNSTYIWISHLITLKIIDYSWKSISLLNKPNRKVECGCREKSPLWISQVLDSGVNLWNSSRNTLLFMVYILVDRSSFSGFHLSLPIIIARILWVRKPMWAFFQFLSMSIALMHFIMEATQGSRRCVANLS